MSLYDILACPICKKSVEIRDGSLQCVQCGRRYPIVNGVPILLPDADNENVQYEDSLIVRDGYDPWIHRMVIQSLADNQIVLDAGCGDMTLDDPCIIRMDIKLTPYVDVVGDLHALPFRSGSLDYIFSLAVFEHLRRPFTACEEIYTALKPGGYVYSECNFVFAYHGYPHHYFNASIHGLRQWFSRFTELRAGVAPYQMPSFALESVLRAYLAAFKASDPIEVEFVRSAQSLFRYPLRRYDAKFTPENDFRIAAGVYFLGIKQPNGNDSLIPAPVMDVYRRVPELQARYPDPNDLAIPDNLMVWAKTQGRQEYPQIAAYFSELSAFSKCVDPSHPIDRSEIKSLPVIVHPDQQRYIDEGVAGYAELSLREKAFVIFKSLGPLGLFKEMVRYLRWRVSTDRHASR
jgi:uncharacterized protein YbaR (Trm112 family)